ncbi:MAG: dinitrogenase iron-molybdenum cofactor biosynthesis protein [Chloroflexi bacterium]|jgi:predicted Fe-Mo cluster-binding NifX family protein|nr:dinitrogenase iron-molybdenum cofactor biosynthesis protein [Chloroflexota bacterium]
MKVLVSSTGESLEADVSPIFGRCPFFILVDSDTMEAEAMSNAAIQASGGAGIQASQFAIQQGAQVVLSGNLGPNAMQVLQAAGVVFYPVNGGTVRQAVEAYKSGQLQAQSTPTVNQDFGKPGGGRRGGGMGRGRGGRL